MSSKSKNGKKGQLTADLTSYATLTETFESLSESSKPNVVSKCLTRLLHHLRKIEQDDFERREALTDAITLCGSKWLRDSDDNHIKENSEKKHLRNLTPL